MSDPGCRKDKRTLFEREQRFLLTPFRETTFFADGSARERKWFEAPELRAK
ncbi:hypothetical protein HED55_00915 [Ochrobactrum haematophilum]|jgi:hypothetical protein|uniref:Uncharacterized protein n=1 Tax=Brucella haematophila TaxID=419474 RepID=A0ABX1DJP6_9HYPH|nr:hypothetical protein [Brucella haematophila]